MNSDPSCLSGLSSGALQQLQGSEGTHRSLEQAGLARVLSPGVERRETGPGVPRALHLHSPEQELWKIEAGGWI